MVIFFIITAVVLCALGAVIWMIWKESSSAEENGLHEKSSSVHEDISAAALLEARPGTDTKEKPVRKRRP